MNKIVITSLAVAAAIALPAAASAQSSDGKPDVTVGASVGLHDLNANVVFNDGIDADDFSIDNSGEISGGFVAVDFPAGDRLFVGAEGNLHVGSGPIDAEYGVSARFGLRTSGGGKFYVRGGYQWIDLDVARLIGVDESVVDEDALGLDTTVSDILVGVGAEFPVGAVVLRANVDTLSFDTVRGTVGIGLKF